MIADVTLFLGHEIKYWIELDSHAQELHVDKLIEEIAILRAKVSFYEDRIDQLAHFKGLIK